MSDLEIFYISKKSTMMQRGKTPRGEYATIKIPFPSQYFLRSSWGKHGCTSTWLTVGTTLTWGSKISKVLIEKLDTPMDLTFPVSSNFSISLYVSMNVGDSCGLSTWEKDAFPTVSDLSMRQKLSETTLPVWSERQTYDRPLRPVH